MWRLAVALALALFLVPGLAFAELWTPGPNAQGSSSITGFIDYPTTGSSVKQGEKLTIYGWVFDSAVAGSTGIDEVDVYSGTSADLFLGRATNNTDRPDVAAYFSNPSWRNSGFTATIDTTNLSIGPQTLSIYAHSPTKGWWSQNVPISVLRGTASADTPIGDPITWKTARGRSVTTVAPLDAALTQVAKSPWGNWAVEIAADQGLEVSWSSTMGNQFSLYQYGSRLILLNTVLKTSDSRSLAAAVAHELQKAVDDAVGWSSWRAVSCQDLEARAYLAQASVWNSFYGPFGKAQPVDSLDEANNAVLSLVTARSSTWLADASAKYRESCN